MEKTAQYNSDEKSSGAEHFETDTERRASVALNIVKNPLQVSSSPLLLYVRI